MKIFAQTLTLPGGTELKGPSPVNSIGDLLTRTFPIALALAGFGLLLMIIAAGFTLLTSAGDAKKMEQGKQRLTNALIGFLLVFASVFLVQVVGKILGIREVIDIFR